MRERTEMNEKPEAPEIVEQSKFLKWIDNFWYHYKWQTLAVLFVLIVVLVSVTQCSSANRSDITVTVACNYTMSDAVQTSIQGILGDVLPEDFDGDGSKIVSLVQYAIYTEKELEAMYTYFDKELEKDQVDLYSCAEARRFNTDRIKTLQSYIMTGECAVWIVSPYVYETLFRDKVNVVSVTELKDTAFYQYYDAIGQLPPETLLVLTKPVIGFMSKNENYQNAEAYFQAVKEFLAP